MTDTILVGGLPRPAPQPKPQVIVGLSMTLDNLINQLEKLQRELGRKSSTTPVFIHTKGEQEGIFCRKPVLTVGIGNSVPYATADTKYAGEAYRPYHVDECDPQGRPLRLAYVESVNITYK